MCWFPPFLLPRPVGWELLSPESQIAWKFNFYKILALLGLSTPEHGGRDHHPAKIQPHGVPSLREGDCWSNCSVLRKEQQKWLKNRSTPPQGRSLSSSSIRHHFHSLCNTRVVTNKWLLGFLLTSYFHQWLQRRRPRYRTLSEREGKASHEPWTWCTFSFQASLENDLPL